ncbi:MAG: DUF2800 domain-containing protein [Alphaproteobacteria bacterium]|nr:DUF2800 domain-containing protein [Alphaproteobacteria bacterium]
MNKKINIFNIEAKYKFTETFGDWVLENYNSSFSDLKIFLPNLRLARNLKNYYQKKHNHSHNNVKVKSIAELDIDDFIDLLPNHKCADAISKIIEVRVLKKLDAILMICDEIKKHSKFVNQNFIQRYKISKTLYDLFEEIEIQQINPNSIELLDDSNMALHQQFTIEFFVEFYSHIKNLLTKNNAMFLQQFHNYLCDQYIDIISQTNVSQKIIIAGSTGSIISSKKLIKCIANYDFGAVVFYGLNYQEKCLEIHPQFFLSQLIDYLEISPSKIINIINDSYQILSYNRQDFINLIFADFNKNLCFESVKNINKSIAQDINIIEHNNEFEEARVIAEICQSNEGLLKKIGIICNNQNLLQIIKNTLNTYNINFNNTSSQSVLNIDIINFLVLLFENKFNNFNSHIFLSFIKHKYFIKLANNKLIEELEKQVFRSDHDISNLSDITNRISKTKQANFIEEIIRNLPTQKNLFSIIKSFEYFADKSIEKILSESIAGEEINDYFSIIKSRNIVFEKAEDLITIFGDVVYFDKFNNDSSIDLLSSIEARLLNYDILIVSSLNDGDFPKIENHGWIGAKIKNELKVNKSLKIIGQNAYDFCNYLSNKKVYLTNSLSRLGSTYVESQFLTRLKTFGNLVNINLVKKTEDFSNRARKFYLTNPQPSLCFEHIPTTYSITEISKLINNPYYIYVKKILKIEELKPIDYEPSHAEFGSFVHNALEEYIKNPDHVNFDKIFDKYFLSKQAKLIWLPKFKIFFEFFLRDNQQFKNCQNLIEESISSQINNIELRGKVDRVIIKDGKLIIIDYKTGQTPSKRSVLEWLEPQLLIYALILSEGILKNYQINQLSYWKLNNSDGSKIIQILDDENEIENLIVKTKQQLQQLFDFFAENKLFFSTQKIDDDNIPNLSRINEWSN